MFSSDCEKSVSFSAKRSGSADEILTIPTTPHSKSVSCQTTSDLHISLLEREFPHLFNKKSNGVGGVCDTPGGDSTLSDFEARDNLKTPQISCSSPLVSFTAISSVTWSERKNFEKLFADRSVLDDSSFHHASITDKTVDVSIQPLPSTEKKEKKEKKAFPTTTTRTDEKPFANARLNSAFDAGVDHDQRIVISNDSTCVVSSTPCNRPEANYCSSVNTTATRREGEMHDLKGEKNIVQRVATNESNESSSCNIGATHSTASKSIDGKQGSRNQSSDDNVDAVCHPNVISNEFGMVQSTRRISPTTITNRSDHSPVKSSAPYNGTTSAVS